MAGRLFFFFNTLLILPWFSLSPFPILFLHLLPISFLSGRSLLALCARPFDMWGSASPGILLLPCPVADEGSEGWRGERGRGTKERKGCCQICQGLLFNLFGDPKGTSQGEVWRVRLFWMLRSFLFHICLTIPGWGFIHISDVVADVEVTPLCHLSCISFSSYSDHGA